MKKVLIPIGTFVVGIAVATTGFLIATPSSGASCVTALDHADELHQLSAEALYSASDSMDAISSFDWDRLDQITAETNERTEVITEVRAEYDAASATCRAGE